MNARALCGVGGTSTIRGRTERGTDRRVRTLTPRRCLYAPPVRIRSARSVHRSVHLRMLQTGALAYRAGMHLAERDRDPSDEPVDVSTEDGPALRDAVTAAERAADDEAAATAARERFRIGPIEAMVPDDTIKSHLEQGELVYALRRRAMLRAPGGDAALGYGGTLYLTSRRLVHLGQVVMSVQLTDIVETSLAGERLLLTLREGEGLSLDVDRPRLLRAEMAEAGRGLRE